MSTQGVIPHRLAAGALVSLCAKPLNLRVTKLDAYGFGAADWDQYETPAFGVGSECDVTLESATAFFGKVTSVSGGVGERILYHAACKGPAEELKADATVEGVFIDRDLAQWKTADSGWDGWPEGQINVELTDKLAFFWPTIEPDSEMVLVDTSEPQTGYGTLLSNTPPAFHQSDFPAGKTLWSAAFYQIGGGATSKRISRVSFIPVGDLSQGAIDALTTPDYNHPIPPVVPPGEDADYFGETESERNRHATYPDMNLWSGLYGLGSHVDDVHYMPARTLGQAPDNCFLGVYACDDLAQLPTADPEAMEKSPYLIYKFAHVRYEAAQRVTVDVDAKFIVFYAAYKPIRYPENQLTMYSGEAAHLLRTAWCARNRLMAQRGQWAYVYGLEVCAQGYEPLEPGGTDDLARAFRILAPDCDVPQMLLPIDLETGVGTTIAIRNPTTLPAAVADLLALYPRDMAYGWWEEKVLRIREKPDGGYVVNDEPGADTTGASTTSDGAVDLVMVAYMGTTGTPLPGTLTVASPSFLTVDKDGAYNLVDETWEPPAGVRVCFVDATSASGVLAAIRIGQAVAIEQRPDQGCGSVTLHAIAGASRVNPGCALAGPGVAADTVITSVSIDVTADTVTFELGHSGYVGRFPANRAGVPLSTTPTNTANSATTLDLRRGDAG